MNYETLLTKLRNNDTDLEYITVKFEAEGISDGKMNHISLENEKLLFSALSDNHTIKHLNLSPTKISETGWNALCEALKKNTSLESIEFTYYKQKYNQYPLEMAKAENAEEINLSMIENLAFVLNKNNQLKKIVMKGDFTSINENMLSILNPFLEKNHTVIDLQFLHTFDVSNNWSYNLYEFHPMTFKNSKEQGDLQKILERNKSLQKEKMVVAPNLMLLSPEREGVTNKNSDISYSPSQKRA